MDTIKTTMSFRRCYILALLSAICLAGCGDSSKTEISYGGVPEIVGSYTDIDLPHVELILMEERYKFGSDESFDQGRYAASKTSEGRYEIKLFSDKFPETNGNYVCHFEKHEVVWTYNEVWDTGRISPTRSFKKQGANEAVAE